MRLTTVAEGEKARGLAAAEVQQAQGRAEAEAQKARGLAEAEVRQAQGLAEAESKKAQGLAEAEAMERKAEAWQKYNEAAVLQLLAPLLPEIARAVAEPLSKIDRITLINTGSGNGEVGISRMTDDIVKVIAQVPPVIESLTGLRLDKLIKQARGPSAEEERSAALPPETRKTGG
jgi:flotillin